MKRKIGLFGGSFNPIHLGHLHLAKAVKRGLKLDGVLLMPAGNAPHKSSAAYVSAEHRAEMCRLAAEKYPWMKVSDYEIRKGGKSYTVETLRALTESDPETEWTLMIGSDMLLTFDKWYCWQEILRMASLCAVSRETGDMPELMKKAEQLRKEVPGAEIRVLRAAAFPASSTEIREKLRNREDCSCLLPENVVQYIESRQLYQADEEREHHGQVGAE
ncbi:MAG: nicotinate (nicotinamide) nucleotide adenylyltransferase [Oscillospiraceae bacterium]|nr:nicotinate (nicotinamide) nucleotide adenylyltransferase [Oscillospiraceae bacterium]